MSDTQKITSIELLRVVAMFAILSMHCQMMLTYWQFDGVPVAGYLLNQLTRFAVPCFFLISGYLIQPKLSQAPRKTLIAYSKPLLRVFIVWSIICLVMPFNLGIVMTEGYLAERLGYWGWLMQNPLNTLLEGGLVHLWFIPALIFAVAIIALFVAIKRVNWLLPVAGALYIYGVLGGSYLELTDIWTPWFTRNGPFFSTLLVVLGYYIRMKNIRFHSKIALMIAILGMVMHFSEAAWLTQFAIPFNVHDFLFGTVIWGTGLFLWALSKPHVGDKPWILNSASLVLGIYVIHMPFIIVMKNVVGILGWQDLQADATIWVGTLLLSLLFVFALRGRKLEKLLFR
jgi:surface polysaccharide O-acyltransferase-like enzyme